ncbi:MAG: hypothetical protein AAF065_04760 [Verrucomicrobiota bacterium]
MKKKELQKLPNKSMMLIAGVAFVELVIWVTYAFNKPEEPTPETPPIAQQPVVVVEPVEPAPVEPEPVEPTPIPELSWQEFSSLRELWPASVNIRENQIVELRFRQKSFGEISFMAGDTIQVSSISKDGFIIGQLNRSGIKVQSYVTNLQSWFDQNHGTEYTLLPAESANFQTDTNTELQALDVDVLTDLRIWCAQNFDTPMIKILEDKVVLKWKQKGLNGIELKQEANAIARAYLRFNKEHGGVDNFANSEIHDPQTGALLATGSAFHPVL